MKKEFLDKIIYLQSNLKANKSNFNKFGGYSYRSCEDIIESMKPILRELNLYLVISDDIVSLNENYKSVNGNNEISYQARVYIKSTASIIGEGEGNIISNVAFAREPQSQKGMNDSQITGSASSYARKYALQGLVGLDDSVDADSNFQNPQKKNDYNKPKQNKPPKLSQNQLDLILKKLGEKSKGFSPEEKRVVFKEVTGLSDYSKLYEIDPKKADEIIKKLS